MRPSSQAQKQPTKLQHPLQTVPVKAEQESKVSPPEKFKISHLQIFKKSTQIPRKICCDQDSNLRDVSQYLSAKVTSLELEKEALHLTSDQHRKVHRQVGWGPVRGRGEREHQGVE
jgi:hypothetical protein